VPSLRQIIAAHAPLLILDAASSRIQVGVFDDIDRARWSDSEEEAGTGLFRGLESLAVDLGEIRGFAFADGPGSLLGIRTAAMALRVWDALSAGQKPGRHRPVFAYHVLELMANALGRPDLTLIADARRGEWHTWRLGHPPGRRPTAELAGALSTPEEFRHWTPLPEGVERVPYRLGHLLPRAADAELFCPTEAPDAFRSEAPSYVTWSPRIHRGPGPILP